MTLVPDLVRAAASGAPSAPALCFGDQTWTWARFDAEVDSVARALDVRPGQYVPVHAGSALELLLTFHATARRGAVFVPFNARLTEREVEALLTQVPHGSAPEGVRAGLFTSGTTGVPRLVQLSEANFLASALANAANLGDASSQRWLGTLPLFHVGGLAMAHRCAVYGACLVLEPSFSAERAASLLGSGAVTHASLVPTTLERVLDAAQARRFTAVQAVLVGGGPMTSSLLRRARKAGLPVLQTWGLTEACSQVTTERLDEADGTTAGPPLPGLSVRIVDERGVCLPSGVIGEIEVCGPTLAHGLGPWLATKDLGSLDSRGRLTIASRRVDLIISGGENVYPLEVEAALREHPDVVDVAVVSRPDAHWGQVPVAFVVERAPVSDVGLEAHARAHLAAFKVPKRWVRVQALPRNALGKLDRLALGRAAID
jgi:O-succinylbenzoic acid--CoA ligase